MVNAGQSPMHRTYSALLLHAIVLICWVAYSFYQPVIFIDFGLEAMNQTYLKIQNVLLVAVPPLSGFFADIYFRNRQKLLIYMMIAVIVTACLFLSLAGIFLNGSGEVLRLIPFFMLVWVVSMNVFYNPGLSLLARSARQSGWSYASAITGSVTDIVFALVGFLIVFFRSLGHSYTFGAGAILVIAASWYFIKTHKIQNSDEQIQASVVSTHWIYFVGALTVGVCSGLVHYKILHDLSEHIEGLDGHIFIPVIMVLCAIALLWLHARLHHYGLMRVFTFGFLLCLLAYILSVFVHGLLGTVLCFVCLIPGIIGLSGSAFGAALDRIPDRWSNLGTGLFLAGFNSMIYFISYV
ncbi:MAG: hypothetical protein U0V49_08290 [Saprospiraceae bacterium]